MSFDIATLLTLGYKLSLLTFSLGALIYALPIPWKGLKIWGPRLVWDSIATMVLISLYYILVMLSNKLPIILGGSWSYFISWLRSLILFATSLKELVILAYAATRALSPLKALSSLLWPIDRLSNVLWIFLATIYGLSVFVKNYYYLLIGLGLTLYSIPFRLGRNAGAWLIAFAIVFNAGLPLLPVFLSEFYSSTHEEGISPIINYGLIYTQINITDLSKKPMNYGIVTFYTTRNDQSTLVGRYIVSHTGLLQSSFSGTYIPLPSKTPLYSYINIDSIEIPLYPFPLTTTYLKNRGNGYLANLLSRNIIWHQGALIVISNASKINILKSDNNSVYFNVNNSNYFVEIRAPKECEYNINVNGRIEQINEGTWYWLGIRGNSKVLFIKGYSFIKILAKNTCQMNPKYPKIFDYYVNFLGDGIFLDINFARSVILLFLTLPLIYLFILFSIAYALARLIGGKERIIPRFI